MIKSKPAPVLLALDFGGTKHATAIVAPGDHHCRIYRCTLSLLSADANGDLEIIRSLSQDLLDSDQRRLESASEDPSISSPQPWVVTLWGAVALAEDFGVLTRLEMV